MHIIPVGEMLFKILINKLVIDNISMDSNTGENFRNLEVYFQPTRDGECGRTKVKGK